MTRVIIIASLSQENDIKNVTEHYRKIGCFVDYPIRQSDKEFSEIVDNYLYRINLADLVVVISKPDGTLGRGSTYELSFAKFLNKLKEISTYDDKE